VKHPHWVEVEIVVRDASGGEVRQHFEYDRHAQQLGDVPAEILDHLEKSAGDERIRTIGPEQAQ
jgi:hypothetical protein